MRRILTICLACILMAHSLEAQAITQNGTGATLRILDSLRGETQEITVKNLTRITIGKLKVTLVACRYPLGNPDTEAYAHLIIHDVREERARFSGWMLASAPALSALDHPRYDVWVLRCSV